MSEKERKLRTHVDVAREKKKRSTHTHTHTYRAKHNKTELERRLNEREPPRHYKRSSTSELNEVKMQGEHFFNTANVSKSLKRAQNAIMEKILAKRQCHSRNMKWSVETCTNFESSDIASDRNVFGRLWCVCVWRWSIDVVGWNGLWSLAFSFVSSLFFLFVDASVVVVVHFIIVILFCFG